MTGLAHTFEAEAPAGWQTRATVAAAHAHQQLGRWGAWLAPVELRWLASREAVLAVGQSAPFGLRALAERETVRLWAPWCWPLPPDDRALQRLVDHELAHAWWLQRTTPSHGATVLPLWLREGWSVLLEPDVTPGLPTELSPSARLRLACGDEQVLADAPNEAYAVAEALCARLLRLLGRRGLTALQRGLREGWTAHEALQRAGLTDPEGWLRDALSQ